VCQNGLLALKSDVKVTGTHCSKAKTSRSNAKTMWFRTKTICSSPKTIRSNSKTFRFNSKTIALKAKTLRYNA